jgi:4-amino-4-deoxy-L-arabinose transferase-like glycosyltransferase
MVLKGQTLCQILLGGCAVVMLTSRVIAPSALQRFDQPRTVSYTADIVVNGRWLLPRDMFGHVATKPPLVNWMAAPVVALGFWQEWAVKWPMVAATLLTTALTVVIARNLFRKIPATAIVADEAALIAGAAWLVNPANMTMIYHCRPDPVLVLFLTAAWMFATAIISENEPNKINIGGFSIAIGLAALAKGPAALLPIIYLPLAAWLIRGQPGFIRRIHWWWAILVGIAIFSLWALPTAIRYPAPFFKDLIGRELIGPTLGLDPLFGGRRYTGGPIAALKLILQTPVWFVQRFLPWSILSIGALSLIGWKRWFRHPLAPAIMWIFLVLVFFALSVRKTADYILPAYPAGAILAAYFCATYLPKFRIQLWQVSAFALVLALGLSVKHFRKTGRDRGGENLKIFAREVESRIANEPVVFIGTGYNTLQFFLHRHQAGRPTAEQMAAAKWVIMPLRDDALAELESTLVTQNQELQFVLGLYQMENVRALIHSDSPPDFGRRPRS